MANPNYPVNCTKGQYTKIATNVLSGNIYRMKTSVGYLQTTRKTGEVAPTLKTEAVEMFVEYPNRESIKALEAIDVYVWCDNEDGILRIDV